MSIEKVWKAIGQLDRTRSSLETAWLAFTAWTALGILSLPAVHLFGPPGALLTLTAALLCGRSGFAVAQLHRDCRDIELELCGCEEVDVIGPLAEGLHDAEGSHRFAIGYALTRLLDKVTSELLPVMTPEQRKALRSILLHDSDGELAVATLRAYEVMGDRYEREVVRMMAEGPQIKGREFRVTAAARRCLLQMDPAYSGPEQGDLLRPVENVATDELLLRPVITRSETRPEQLLRASHNATDAEDC